MAQAFRGAFPTDAGVWLRQPRQALGRPNGGINHAPPGPPGLRCTLFAMTSLLLALLRVLLKSFKPAAIGQNAHFSWKAGSRLIIRSIAP